MVDPIVFVGAFVFIALLFRITFAAEYEPREITADATLDEANGCSIVVGENHSDRVGLDRILTLISAAHDRGYRTLGVEVCTESTVEYSGLAEELTVLRRSWSEPLSEDDDRSSLDKDATGKKLRMNRYWYMRAAMRLGWKIVSIDPNHWNWMQKTAYGYRHSREPTMAKAIAERELMIAVCGYGHMQGLSAHLASDATFVVASAVHVDHASEEMWEGPIEFATTLSRLT